MRTDSQRMKTGGWAVVARQELGDLWLSAKGLSVLFGFTVLISILAYLAAADAGINLLDARESVGLIVQTSIGLGTLAALVVSADAISGERERGTLESLLVTPLPRRQLVIGKLLAATSMWIACMVVALPFVAVLADGPGVAFDAVAVFLLAGILVAAALTALGLSISSISMSNRVSLAASVAILLLLVAPSQLAAIKAKAGLSAILIKANPVSSGLELATNVLVRQRPWGDQWPYLISPVVAVILFTSLAVIASKRIELGGSR